MHKDALGIPSQNNKNTHWTCILDDRKWQLKDKTYQANLQGPIVNF